ncbi:MAG TPA: class I SAM-dependent methyltransferase [Azospirillum sp.]|nr:class I SAM-dependent methyltransferase [Azospirillum sp.]
MVEFLARPDERTAPDVETAGDGYARRFAGRAGSYLLKAQEDAAARLLGAAGPCISVLDVGGGHGQLTPFLLARAHRVVVHGSAPDCAGRLAPLLARHPGRLRFVVSGLDRLPFPNDAFDLVVGIRLMAHVERWHALLDEMARVCRGRLLIDFAPDNGANALTPLLFPLKRWAEGNTRPYLRHRPDAVAAHLAGLGFARCTVERQLLLPMVVHRRIAAPRPLDAIETAARRLGLTRRWGGPALLLAQREAPP